MEDTFLFIGNVSDSAFTDPYYNFIFLTQESARKIEGSC